MQSMTGYGSSTFSYGEGEWILQIRGVNHRFLDLAIKIPTMVDQLEDEIGKRIKSQIKRGRVDVLLRVDTQSSAKSSSLDGARVSSILKDLRSIAKEEGISETVNLGDLIHIPEIFHGGNSLNIVDFKQTLFTEIDKVLGRFLATRAEEGEALKYDLSQKVTILEDTVTWVHAHQERMEERFRAQLIGRYNELLDDQIPQDRLTSEVTFLLMKYGINEEVVRLEAHCKSFRKVMENEGSLGKELEFLIQEIHREVNTIGSKSTDVELSNRVIAMKGAVEDMREQLRNVE